jgi:hypothetical protein
LRNPHPTTWVVTMKIRIGAICSSMIGLLALSSPALTQQKTVKACQEEWRAKAANQANGVTERGYVEQCRGGGAQPTASIAPSVTSSPTPMATTSIPPLPPTRTTTIRGQAATTAPSVAPSQWPMATIGIPPLSPTRTTTIAGQKTVESCQEEWSANKAVNPAKGVTKKAYVEQCRGGGVPVQATAAPAPSAAPSLWRPATAGIPPLLLHAATAGPPVPASSHIVPVTAGAEPR